MRLCVVAPTVNINLDDRCRSFCSGLPEEKIRAFVEGTVLPRFTRVLLHPGTDTDAPFSSSVVTTAGSDNVIRDSNLDGNNGGGSAGVGGNGQADFDRWLREMLVDMQASIERHVARVFESQTAVHPVDAAVVAAQAAVSGVGIRR